MFGLKAARLYVPDCRSIFARDGPVLLKAVTTWQREHFYTCPGNLAGSGCMQSVCFVLFVYRCDLAIRESAQIGTSGAHVRVRANRSSGFGNGYLSTSNNSFTVILKSPQIRSLPSFVGTTTIGAAHALCVNFRKIPKVSNQSNSLPTASFRAKGIGLALRKRGTAFALTLNLA